MSSQHLLIAALLCAAGVSFAQGPLAPPGPPGPIFKTLQQVEPRTPIGSLPFVISEPGSYYLTTNLHGGGGLGLTISNSHVTVDLMGFELSGGIGSGIYVAGARSNLWIRNGTVRGWFGWGIDAEQTRDCRFEDLRASQNGLLATVGGLRAGSASLIRNCTANGNNGPGIQVSGDRSRVQANHLTFNGTGLSVSGVENVIIHNSASGNAVDYSVAPGNDLGPVGRAATLVSPWGNIGAPVFVLAVSRTGSGSGTVTSVPTGINCGVDCTEGYADGTMVTLTASPDPGSVFAGWTGGGCSGLGDCTVTMDTAKSVSANFTLNTYSLTVSRTGNGNGTVTSSPVGINCGVDCNESYASGTMVTLTATPDANSTFTGWSGGCSGIGNCTVTMDGARSVTATFTRNSYALTVARTGNGTVTSTPSGIFCGATCSALYDAGTMVTLTATPDPGWTFMGWSGGCSGNGTCTVTMNAAMTVTATFVQADYALTVTKTGTGSGVVTSSPAGINCGEDCNESYSSGTMVTLTATPDASSTFTGWSGGCSGTGTCTLTMDAAKSVTATFTRNSYLLTTARAGAGSGTVTSSPVGINCGVDCSESYDAGTMVTLNASPSVGSIFTGWSGSGCSGTGPCVVTMNSPLTVTATFALDTYILTVNRIGNGTGLVTSNPGGITCGPDCSEAYSYGTMVTLTASPNAGSTFAGWSGSGCSGTGPCVVTIDGAKNVTATFTSP